ncbi:hypothetical protein EDB92DRAFT_1862468 [Lactarius akahatsu]|uniref:DUF6532 domain-containing protein n=1 Tax=Lactarius akahatsu TaxID=416441 RepID=A0AAD4LGL0_9AGAM|nr:hypothetical protein EDB92DRAFT_1862468 [Lactarius akahatsu]
MSNLLPSAQARRGDENLDRARSLRDQFREMIPNDGMVSLQNRITMTTEMRVGLDSKRGLSKWSHARTYRKHAEETLHLVKTASDRARDAEFGGPQDGTYDEQMRRTIDAAEATYRCFLSSKDAFPTPEQASNWAKSVWPVASTKTGTRLNPPDDLADRLTIVVSRLRPLVTKFYGTDTTFINGEHGIPYRHPIIQQCINVVWFGDRHGEGVRFPNEFNPMPYEAVALVLTAIECCLDEWSNGVQTELPFTYERYKVTYMSYLTALKALTQQGLDTRHCDPLHQLRRDFYEEGR